MTAGADINFMDINGDTPLHHASRNGINNNITFIIIIPIYL